jgi:hypothetical protein
MILFIVIGLPALLLRMLWPWRYPFNRLYESSEAGDMVPTVEGMKHAGGLYGLYKSECWAQGLVTMAIKVFLAALLGVLFQTNQIGGAFVSALFCGVVMAYFAQVRPFVYENGNVLSVLSFGSLLTSYTAAAFKKLNHDLNVERGVETFSSFNASVPEGVVFFIWLLPYLYAVVDALGLDNLLEHGVFVLGRRCSRLRVSKLIRRRLKMSQRRAKDLKAKSRSQMGRVDRTIDILTSQLELGDTAHTVACARLDGGGWGGDKDKLDAALACFKDGVEDMLKTMTMVASSTKGGARQLSVGTTSESTGMNTSAAGSNSSAHNVIDCLLGWEHCRRIEDAATALSMEAYPVDAAGQDDWGDARELSNAAGCCMKRAQVSDAAENGGDAASRGKSLRGFVGTVGAKRDIMKRSSASTAGGRSTSTRKSRQSTHTRIGSVHVSFYARADGLLKVNVSNQLRRYEGGENKRPDMAHLELWHRTIVTLLKPGSDFGWFDFKELSKREHGRRRRQIKHRATDMLKREQSKFIGMLSLAANTTHLADAARAGSTFVPHPDHSGRRLGSILEADGGVTGGGTDVGERKVGEVETGLTKTGESLWATLPPGGAQQRRQQQRQESETDATTTLNPLVDVQHQRQQNQQQQGKHGERVDGGKRNIAGADGGTDEAMLAMTASPTFEHLAKLDIFRSTIVLYLDRGSATVAGCASRRCLAGVAAYILKVIAAEGVAEDEKLDTLRRNRINSPSKVRTRCKPTLFPYHGILPYCLPLVCVHRLWRIVGRRSLLSWELNDESRPPFTNYHGTDCFISSLLGLLDGATLETG